MKTQADVVDLKAQWKADPCWDIGCTEGFEDYAEELENMAAALEGDEDVEDIQILDEDDDNENTSGS